MGRLIDADKLIEAMGEEPYVWTDSADEIAERNQWLTDMHIIESAPTIDAVEVVRCGECKHGGRRNDADIECKKHKLIMRLKDYCSYGERKGGRP